jgi:hypothetical protein
LKNDPFCPKTASFQKLFILFFLSSRGNRSKKPSKRPLLDPIVAPNPSQILDQIVYHRSYKLVQCFSPSQLSSDAKITQVQQPNNGRTVGVFIPPNN